MDQRKKEEFSRRKFVSAVGALNAVAAITFKARAFDDPIVKNESVIL